MSDTEQKTPNKTGASGAAWTEAEKIVYLILLCENEGKIESKIANAPIPVGRSVVSCKKLLFRLKEKYKVDLENMKNGLPMSTATATAAATTGADGEDNATPTKPTSTPRKRKAKAAEGENEGNGEAEGSPKKKAAGGRKKKADAAIKEEVKEEQAEDEMMV